MLRKPFSSKLYHVDSAMQFVQEKKNENKKEFFSKLSKMKENQENKRLR